MYITLPKYIKFNQENLYYVLYKNIEHYYYCICPFHSTMDETFGTDKKYIHSPFFIYPQTIISKFFNKLPESKRYVKYEYCFISDDDLTEFIKKYEYLICPDIDTQNFEAKKKEFYYVFSELIPTSNFFKGIAIFFEKGSTEGTSGFIFVNFLGPGEELEDYYYPYNYARPVNSNSNFYNLFEKTLLVLKQKDSFSRNTVLEALINSAKFKVIEYKNKKKNERIEFLRNFIIAIIIGGIYLYISD
ncbi:hypothetical protein [Fusobacterium ulcerans]|uniref:hypothetical protein n=1 Tax=Fusobacterium ulcerans TaxID=861 RepID=UPI0030A4644B